MSTMKEDIFGDIVLDREEVYEAKEHDTVPPIDRDLLRGSAIFLSNDAPLPFAE